MSRRVLRVPLFIINSMLVVPLGCATALIWANAAPESYYNVSHILEFAVNDVAMALFFGLVATEVVAATLTGGVLHPWRRAALPVAAAFGGAVVPIAIYVFWLHSVSEHMLPAAWPVTCAVDIAACYLVGGLIFGKHPAVPFLLLLAIASNAIGLAAIAVLQPVSPAHIVIGLSLLAIAMVLALAMRRSPVKSFWPYLLLPGVLSWTGLYLAGVHPAIALLPIVPFMPHARHDQGLFEEPPVRAHDALSSFERFWAPPVQAVLFLFGVVNAGVPLHGLEPGMWALPIATVIGRPIGVLIFVELAVLAGLHRTLHVGWKELVVVGSITSIGLSFALFSGAALVPTGPLQLQLKTGALLTAIGAVSSIGVAWALGVGRFHRRRAVHAEPATQETR